MFGEDGDDVLRGGDDMDGLHGGSGNDRLEGGEGDDELSAGDGDDRCIGGGGSDVCDGGAPNAAPMSFDDPDICESAETKTNCRLRGLKFETSRIQYSIQGFPHPGVTVIGMIYQRVDAVMWGRRCAADPKWEIGFRGEVETRSTAGKTEVNPWNDHFPMALAPDSETTIGTHWRLLLATTPELQARVRVLHPIPNHPSMDWVRTPTEDPRAVGPVIEDTTCPEAG